MTEQNQIFKCNVCGNTVEMVHTGKGQLVCCGQPMEAKTPNTQEASHEKHVPVVEMSAEGVRVKIGSAPHPMEEKHYIEWIELVAEGRVFRQHLRPGEQPEAEFCLNPAGFTARAYCNLHGLWQK